MTEASVQINIPGRPSTYEIAIGHGLLTESSGALAAKILARSGARVHIVSNPTVDRIYGEQLTDSLANAGFTVSKFLMPDGERHKSLKTAQLALRSFAEAGLTRTDAVIALGGGVVGDLAGFASAIYLRGITFIQIPTTLLAMIDSSVGGKTGVNSEFGKNLIGAFHQPLGVIIDPSTLATLEPREITAGLCEMIKHGAIGGKALLGQTSKFLSGFPLANFRESIKLSNFRSDISNLIAANVQFKAKIVAGDERESSNRRDGKSRKILNFGHTLAHALEKVTDYKYFKHGEAVGYGILFTAELSKVLALCDEKDVKLLNDVVHMAGILPPMQNIDSEAVIEAFRFDKKHLAGSLQMILLKGIGKPVILTDRDIPRSATQKVLKQLLHKWA